MFIYNSNSTGEVPPLQTINSCGQVEPDHHIPELIEMFTGQDEAMEKLGGYAGRMSGVTMSGSRDEHNIEYGRCANSIRAWF